MKRESSYASKAKTLLKQNGKRIKKTASFVLVKDKRILTGTIVIVAALVQYKAFRARWALNAIF